ncbi:MAG: hypothetical protein NC822_06185 [Candidatus Omnitrophica bacterium]|nr:hypothetical protein [Candidatus Omnitrophota bacterium]MCM8827150.1 hypothetical protein [Candidatus Omnitrophota bacterium]
METKFLVSTRFVVNGLGLVLSGELKSGSLMEGAFGRTPKGKKCAVVKIDVDGVRTTRVNSKQKANVVVKYVEQNDIMPGDIIYFE